MLSCTDIHGNAGGDWVAAIADQLGQDGNCCADPLFCDISARDYTLAAESPCAPAHSGGCGQIGAHPVGCTLTPVGPDAVAATLPTLDPPVPNPGNPEVVFTYTAHRTGLVRLAIFGVDGRQVALLVEEVRSAGPGRAVWRGVDRHGRSAPSGVYLAVLEAGGIRRCQTVMLVR